MGCLIYYYIFFLGGGVGKPMCSMYGRYVYLDVAKTYGKSRLGIPIHEASGKWLKLGFQHIFNRRLSCIWLSLALPKHWKTSG